MDELPECFITLAPCVRTPDLWRLHEVNIAPEEFNRDDIINFSNNKNGGKYIFNVIARSINPTSLFMYMKNW
jgi:hypothetical protein